MTEPIISVTNIGKLYQLGFIRKEDTLRDKIAFGIKNLVDKKLIDNKESQKKKFWALKNISFDVQQGEVLGIIGRNGAGKSTLLKILSKITEPTEGEIIIMGRIASLLEVGTGFHPELSGRENIYMNGAILGMSRFEIKSKFDEIVAFAEVEKFIDTPVKRYSSGMYVRLAFAVAAHLEPEILLVDEVLAVGDFEFQKKCLGKMKDVSKSGRTVLFVSHNMAAIKSLCARCILLEAGKLKLDDSPDNVVSHYLKHGISDARDISWEKGKGPGKYEFELRKLSLLNSSNSQIINSAAFNIDEPIIIELTYDLKKPVKDLRVGIQLLQEDGTPVFLSYDIDTISEYEKLYFRERGQWCAKVIIPSYFLNPGDFLVQVWVRVFGVKVHLDPFEQGNPFLRFSVSESVGFTHMRDKRDGPVRLKLKWKTNRISESF